MEFTMDHKTLFTPAQLGKIVIANRIVMAPSRAAVPMTRPMFLLNLRRIITRNALAPA
jgi:hypothetical protein